MTTNIQFLHMKNHEWMETFVQEKLAKLEKKYNWITQAKVYFKVEKAANTDQNICEIELHVPGPPVFAKATADTFESSVLKTIADLDKILKKRKAKMYNTGAKAS